MTFTPGSLSSSLNLADRLKQEQDMQTMKKEMRQKEAELKKENAILHQQVELLKIQLQESQEREINLKKMNENVMNALKRDIESPAKQSEL